MTSLLALLFVMGSSLAAVANSEEAPSHPGPRSKQTADFLFSEAEKELQAEKFAAARKNLQKFIRFYPTDERYLRATELVTELALQAKDWSAAISAAKSYLLLDSKSETAQKVRTKLVDAYFRSGKSSLAKATAQDLLKQSQEPHHQAQALYLLARIDLQEKKWTEARAKLDALPADLSQEDVDSLRLEIGVQECRAIQSPPAKTVADDPWILYFERSNRCLKQIAVDQNQKRSHPKHALWCELFKQRENELKKSKINAFQRKRLQDEFKSTAELASSLLQCDPPL